MAEYINNLDWMYHPEDFTPNERKILLALSNKRWKWFTVDALRMTVDLRESEFVDALETLMIDGIVRAGTDKTYTKPLLGLAERVGRGARPINWRRKPIETPITI